MHTLEQYEHVSLSQVEKLAQISTAYIAWKDKDYCYRGANQNACELMQLSSTDEIIGLYDRDINWLSGGHTADYFNAIDKEVMRDQYLMTHQKEIVLRTNKKGEVIIKVVLATKRRLVNNLGTCIGVALQGIDITDRMFPTLYPAASLYSGSKYPTLTPREKDCAQLLLKGYVYKQVACRLGVSVRTVEAHVTNIRNKLQCVNKQTLILKLVEMRHLLNSDR